MFAISREYWFSAAHQIEGHPKCGRLHGHNYRVEVTITADSLTNGMIMDYAQMDFIIKPIIDGRLDHRYIVSEANVKVHNPILVYGVTEHFVRLPIDQSTAEEISKWLYHQIQGALPKGTTVLQLILEETPKSKAIYLP